MFLKINLQEPMSIFFYPSQSACRLCQSHGRSPEVQGFPPLPFAAIHCRQTTINNAVRKRGSGQLLLHSPLPETPLSQSEPIVISPRVDSGRRLLFFSFTFVRLTHRILDVRIVPLSVQIMKSCSTALRPLEDYSDGSEQ